MPGNSFTEVTSRSWFGRIGESIKGVIVGIVLLVAVIIDSLSRRRQQQAGIA